MMKILTYNIMSGGVKPDPSRLEKVLQVISEQDADVVGLQETKVVQGEDNELVHALRKKGTHPYDIVFDRDEEWTFRSAAALFSRRAPISSRIVGERVRAVEMIFPTVSGSLSVSNVYLSHISEEERLPQVRELLQELQGNPYSILIGDLNALSPEDGIPPAAVEHFSEKMMKKYCRDGKICYDTVEAVLEAGYVDVALQHHRPEEITDRTDVVGSTRGGGHTMPLRMDFIFAGEAVLPYVTHFALVREGLARTASDHFPWIVTLDDTFLPERKVLP